MLNPLSFLKRVLSSAKDGNNRFARLDERLLADRIILVGTAIDDEVANQTIAKLLYLEDQAPGSPIHLYINSPGGAVMAGLAVLDTMDRVKAPVKTVCLGRADAMAAQLVAHGAHGHRSAVPSATFSISSPWGGQANNLIDAKVQRKETGHLQAVLISMLAKDTGQRSDQVSRNMREGTTFSSSDAKVYGLIDEISHIR